VNIVDEAVFTALEAAGMWAEGLHDENGEAPTSADMLRIMDGLVEADNETNVVRYDTPYAVYYSSLGDDPPTPENMRMSGQRGRRSVFFSVVYVGADRRQAKHAGQRIRDALAGKRLTVPGHRVWLTGVEESQRVRRDDDAIRPDGSPLFYGVDEYAVSITLNHEGVSP
jgi:hypothetical protein